MLAKRRSEQLFPVPSRAIGTVGFRADRNVGTLFCPALARPAVRRVPRRPDPPVVVSGFWTRQVLDSAGDCSTRIVFPGHALHEKGLQRQIAVGTLVNSQQRRALAVPVINRLPTAGQPRVNRLSTACFVPPPVYIGFPLFLLAKRRSEQLFTVP